MWEKEGRLHLSKETSGDGGETGRSNSTFDVERNPTLFSTTVPETRDRQGSTSGEEEQESADSRLPPKSDRHRDREGLRRPRDQHRRGVTRERSRPGWRDRGDASCPGEGCRRRGQVSEGGETSRKSSGTERWKVRQGVARWSTEVTLQERGCRQGGQGVERSRVLFGSSGPLRFTGVVLGVGDTELPRTVAFTASDAVASEGRGSVVDHGRRHKGTVGPNRDLPPTSLSLALALVPHPPRP